MKIKSIKTFILCFVVLFLNNHKVCSQVQNQKKEKTYIINYLKETNFAVFKTIENIPLALWNYRPSDGGWTIAEIAEHIAEAEKVEYNNINNKFLVNENKNGPLPNAAEIDIQIIKLTTDRTTQLKAPEQLFPKGKWDSPDDFLIYFEGLRNRTISYVENSTTNFRLYTAHFPPLDKNIDAYHWLLIIASHTQRHLAQIEENRQSFINPNN